MLEKVAIRRAGRQVVYVIPWYAAVAARALDVQSDLHERAECFKLDELSSEQRAAVLEPNFAARARERLSPPMPSEHRPARATTWFVNQRTDPPGPRVGNRMGS
jgi:hypothetical protein